ncbi:MAG TPA: biopolymer transporter ExbD [Opitutaceae bacterium]|nr:biopolymer transporter ExbD [Opitutaceae bacterium]
MAGGGSRQSGDGKKKARIEIIPLIDVIFFLLATFVLFTLSLDKIQSLPVTLPVPSNTPADPDDKSVNLQVSDGNNLYWNHELITMEEVEPRIAQYKTEVAEPRILISGDEKAKFGVTVKVLDLVRKSGITQVSVETRTGITGK